MFKNVEAPSADFSGAYMAAVKMDNTVLDRSVLSGAYIAGGSFEKITMTNIIADKAFMVFCRFHNCNAANSSFVKIKFSGAFFLNSVFSGCDFSSSDFSSIDYNRGHFLQYRELGIEVNDEQINIIKTRGVSILSTSFTKCDFRGAKLNKINKKYLIEESDENSSGISWSD